jgi:hypothetical protein
MKTETYTAVRIWGDAGWRNNIQQLYFLISSLCFATREVTRWPKFKQEAQELLNSGSTSRFVRDENTNSVFDKETGQTWPLPLFRELPRLDREG